MAENKHFSHQHSLTFHKSLEGSQLTCSGCMFPCTGTPIYSCRPCKFFLQEQCFHATRSLNHRLHPKHPLSLFPSPTYTQGSFLCNLCSKTGSGFCFSCTTCEFDLHVHCAYNGPKTSPPPNQVQIKSHPNHPLRYHYKPPYKVDVNQLCSCDVCGTLCDLNSPLYHCDICGYDAHLECVSLQETVKREDHPHALSLLHVNPYVSFECDVCRENIDRKHCMYLCKSGCNKDYGLHVKCVSAQVKVNEKISEMSDRQFQLEMFKLQSQLQKNKISHDNFLLLASSGYNHIRF